MRMSSEDNNTRGELTETSSEDPSWSNMAYLDTDAVRRRAMTVLEKDVGKGRNGTTADCTGHTACSTL